MPGWVNSDRRSRLPANWKQLREERIRIDGDRCTATWSDGTRCDGPADEVDHHVRGDNHSVHNLRCLCEWHHQQKSAREGAEALNRRRQQVATKFRRTEAHPFA